MKIESSSISMLGKSNSIQHHEKNEALRVWVGNERPDFEGHKLSQEQLSNLKKDILDISDEAKALQEKLEKELAGVQGDEYLELDISDKDRQKLLAIQKMIELLTGKKIKFNIPKKIKLENPNPNFNVKSLSNQAAQQPKAGWGLEYDMHEVQYEKQQMSFASSGVVRTADGREINFSLELNMSREFYSEQNVSIRAGDALKKDPLVINFDSAAAGLTDEKISFDIDSDGSPDQISFLTQGSGFLAIDNNNDGKINDGRELFGPGSGDGFAELAQYDSDGNNWIDENDPIYEKLRIWTKDENGNDVLFALGQKGVGAIYLGNVSTQFDVKNVSNDLQGSITQTGVFLKEDGTPGTIQHVDLAI